MSAPGRPLSPLAPIVVVALTVAIDGCARPGRDAFDADQEQQQVVDPFVAAHNAVRSGASPTPDPALAPLAWSTSLAATAQAWAEGCVFEHSDAPLGENLAFFSGTGSTAENVVGGWADEARFYDYESNRCAAGEQCGHYTQVVWRDTERVGCGAAECNIFGTDGLYWVCNYDPPGNFVGERPY